MAGALANSGVRDPERRGVAAPRAQRGAIPRCEISPAPWYTSVGFIAAIPAVPFIMPYLLGLVLLRGSIVEFLRAFKTSR
jgi:hypothetical protein